MVTLVVSGYPKSLIGCTTRKLGSVSCFEVRSSVLTVGPVGLFAPEVFSAAGNKGTDMTISEENVAELVMVRAGGSRSHTIKENTGIGCASICIHAGKIMVTESKGISFCKCITAAIPKRILFGLLSIEFCYCGAVCRRFCGSGRADIHLHIRQNSVYDQGCQSFRRFFISRFGCGRQNHVVREIGE